MQDTGTISVYKRGKEEERKRKGERNEGKQEEKEKEKILKKVYTSW